MALPETVVQQLGREASKTPGWSWGIISFSGGILFIAVFLWAGLSFGYKPYLDSQSAQVGDQINTVEQSVSPVDQANLINFYSQLSNLRTLLNKHTPTSDVFNWLEANTESNVSYTSFSLGQDNHVSIAVQAKTENDANQQIAIFETSPQVKLFTTTGIALGTGGQWQFQADLTLDPSVFAPATAAPSSQ